MGEVFWVRGRKVREKRSPCFCFSGCGSSVEIEVKPEWLADIFSYIQIT